MGSSWQFHERAQKEVYRKLQARQRLQAVVEAGWGFLDHFFIFLFSLGFFARVDFRLKRVKRVMVPAVLMILTYEVKQLIGISSWAGKEYEVGEEKIFLTSLSVGRPLRVLEQYDLRSEIENQDFRELKQGYHLLKYPQKTGSAVRAHAILTLIIYSLVNAYKSQRGQRLAHLGIRRLRGKQMGQSIHKMIVYYEGIYGIVDVEELFYLMDMTPKELFRLKIKRFRREIE
ncbi:MAG: hypothetical protein FJ107_05240 [Deltaproteobacteria bacterium]|nr:hypothetical protein [Deltaproteobacteria bacterium]MBM4347521.1 hypothetical protein [Deltaproteobacteria bacterium]